MAFRSAATKTDPSFGSTLDVIINKPAGTASGDILLLAIFVDLASASTGSPTFPSGFTGFIDTVDAANARLLVAWKLAGGAEPATYTTNLSQNDGGFSAALMAYSGRANVLPIDSSGSNVTPDNPSPTPVSANSITVLSASCDLVYIGGSDSTNDVSVAWSTPAGFTQRVSLNPVAAGIGNLTIADKVPSTGATGAISSSITNASGTNSGIAALVAIKTGAAPAASSIAWITA